MREYIEQGVYPGRYLEAVISNSLCNGLQFVRSGFVDWQTLYASSWWLIEEAPRKCWGSKAKMDAWMAARAAE